MVTVGMNYQVLPGRQGLFEDKFTAVLEAMRATEGHVTTKLYRDTADDASYLIISEWSSKPAFASFIRSDDFKRVTDWGKAEVLSARPSHQVYETSSL